ncbi:MAG: type II secretion system minor pseudopilin GspK [Pseudomonadota bacterium]
MSGPRARAELNHNLLRLTRQTGVALISVLLIVAILMAVASRLLANHNLVINQHQNTFEFDQALNYALGAEVLATQALLLDAQESTSDHLEEIWAQDILPFELDEGGFIEAQMTDLHSCFNLNNVRLGKEDEDHHKQAKALLQLLGMGPDIADAWRDWVDGDNDVTGLAGAEENVYLVADPAYRTPNQDVTSTSELLLLANIDKKQLQELLPHVCLLPTANGPTKINVNTAGALVLASLMDQPSLGVTEPIVMGERAYEDTQSFTNAHQDYVTRGDNLEVTSQYFSLHVQAQVGDATVTLQSLLYRSDPNTVTVLARDFGKLFVSNLQVETTLN